MPAHLPARHPATALVLVALSGVSLLGGQQLRAQPRSALTATQWAEDLDFLVSTIRTRHLNPFAHQSSRMFDEKVAALTRALPGLRDDDARMVALARLAVSIGDGHTNLEIYRSQPLVPIRVFWFGRDL